jgi:pilus assembly protein CpaF
LSIVTYEQLEDLRKNNVFHISFADEVNRPLLDGQKAAGEVIKQLNQNYTNLINLAYRNKIPKTTVEDKIDEILYSGIIESSVSMQEIKKITLDELFGYGAYQLFIDDPEITDVFVNKHDQVLVRKKGIDYPVSVSFKNVEELEEYFRKILSRLGAQANDHDPIVDTRDSKQHLRINGAVRPVVKEPYFTIRKHQADTFNDINRLVQVGTLTQEIADDLRRYVGSWLNILISGPTGSGKTTFMRCLVTSFVDKLERIAVLEEEEELQIQHNNIVSMETKKKKAEDDKAVEMDILVKNGMRMSARRIILGELRYSEALELIRAFGTGHDGGFTSIHANSVRNALKQLAFLMLYANTPLKYEHLLDMISESVDLVIHVERHKVVEIAEVEGYDPIRQEIKLSPIWKFDVDPATDQGEYRRYDESETLAKKMALRRALKK